MSSHRLVANAVVPVSASLVGNTGGVPFCVAGTATEKRTATASTMGPRARTISVIEIKVTINSDGCKERTGKGVNVVSNIINEAKTIDVGIHLLFQVKEQSTKKNKKQTKCFQGDHDFVGQASSAPTT